MQGEEEIQQLINVHFSSPSLGKAMALRSAMLYFVFNQVSRLEASHIPPIGGSLVLTMDGAMDGCLRGFQDVISVLVTHHYETGEFVCQLPFFPPVQTPKVSHYMSTGRSVSD